MNKVRVLGIIIFILGFYFMYLADQYETGFLIGMLTGIVPSVGFAFMAFGKFKFWEKI